MQSWVLAPRAAKPAVLGKPPGAFEAACVPQPYILLNTPPFIASGFLNGGDSKQVQSTITLIPSRPTTLQYSPNGAI